jgi:hypothetical protein
MVDYAPADCSPVETAGHRQAQAIRKPVKWCAKWCAKLSATPYTQPHYGN